MQVNLCAPLDAESSTEDAPAPPRAGRMAVHSRPCSRVWLGPQDGEHMAARPSHGPTETPVTQPRWEKRDGKHWGSWTLHPHCQKAGLGSLLRRGRMRPMGSAMMGEGWTHLGPAAPWGKATTRLWYVFCSPVKAAALVQWPQRGCSVQSQTQSLGQETAETSWGLEKNEKKNQKTKTQRSSQKLTRRIES